MFLVMGITGKVGGATAQHLLAHGKEVRALVRNREKAAYWANQGVELVDGDWNDSAAIEQALKGVEGAFVMLPAVWAPSPDYKEAKGVIANYVEAHWCTDRSGVAEFLRNSRWVSRDGSGVSWRDAQRWKSITKAPSRSTSRQTSPSRSGRITAKRGGTRHEARL